MGVLYQGINGVKMRLSAEYYQGRDVQNNVGNYQELLPMFWGIRKK